MFCPLFTLRNEWFGLCHMVVHDTVVQIIYNTYSAATVHNIIFFSRTESEMRSFCSSDDFVPRGGFIGRA